MESSFELNLGPMDKARICPYCGMAFMPRSAKHQFCCRECYRRYALEQGEVLIPEALRCPHNDTIVCHTRRCGECGWNPVVAKRRTERIMRTHTAKN